MVHHCRPRRHRAESTDVGIDRVAGGRRRERRQFQQQRCLRDLSLPFQVTELTVGAALLCYFCPVATTAT
ncbi:hypothetical protein C0J52_27527 [Blattella germanica]|nr:hypothetical protein C0J52_27527 [Blattella germanica]